LLIDVHLMKSWLFLSHRWMGVFGGVLILLWFVSGMVMMYMPFPSLTDAERLAQRDALDATQIKVSPLSAVKAALAQSAVSTDGINDQAQSSDEKLMQLRLIREGSEQLYAVRLMKAGWVGVDALTGQIVKVKQVDAAHAAIRFAGAGRKVASIERIDRDQWSVPSRFDAHRPLWVVRMHDGGQHYVSSRTGEVVLDTTRLERGWNWVGAVVHWIYPTILRSRAPVWHWVVVVLSSYALLTAMLGVVIGVLRWKRYASGHMTPYRGVMRWHHLLGLGSALFVVSWLLSGLLSMNPLDVFSSRSASQEQVSRWRGVRSGQENESLPDGIDIGTMIEQINHVKEVEWFPNEGGALAWLRLNEQRGHLMQMTSHGVIEQTVDQQFIARRVGALGTSLSVQRLDHYDTYYDARHRSKPLPIWRIQFNDANHTWFHVDAANGQLLGKLDDSVRAERWLYNGLHSWDLEWLITRRPVWDVAMLLALSLGTVFSATAVVIGWRRLRRKM
jgi:hypothetical protein